MFEIDKIMKTAKELILELQELVNKFNTADIPVYVHNQEIESCNIEPDYSKEQFCIRIKTKETL